jgi:pimeloyl-ACP methyl ester carboxylesterase
VTDQEWTPPPALEVSLPGGRMMRYCAYGPADGLPVVSLTGTPGTRWERPDVVSAFERAGLRVVAPDRPGYGGSGRQPGRAVADIAADVEAIADAEGWGRFAVTGFSGGGPHALACAALLAGRVTCCAAIAPPAPPDAPGAAFFADPAGGSAEDFRLALRGEQELRPYLEARSRRALSGIDAGETDRGRAIRLRAMYAGGPDGWVDDVIALAHPWGFEPASISVPVSLWYGLRDSRIPRSQKDGLLAQLPAAEVHQHPDGHDPGEAISQQIFEWIAAAGA